MGKIAARRVGQGCRPRSKSPRSQETRITAHTGRERREAGGQTDGRQDSRVRDHTAEERPQHPAGHHNFLLVISSLLKELPGEGVTLSRLTRF